VSFQPVDRQRIPVLLLSESAQSLICDVFGRRELFRDFPRIRRRVVAWGRSATVVELEHSAIVLSEDRLLECLGPALPADGPVKDVDWTIYASRPLPAAVSEHRFGSRMASATAVELKSTAEPATCWIESVEDGWLFLISTTRGSGSLLSVGLGTDALLAESQLIREQIATSQPAVGQFPASPRIVSPLGDLWWLACGTAAMAFDPICGDGTAHAVREAILAAAVISAAARGEAVEQLLAHYETRLIAGFHRHLSMGLSYYGSGGSGPWWRAESEAIREGLHWCGRQLSRHPKYRYQLAGFDLCAIP
jgi:hypothetical protein